MSGFFGGLEQAWNQNTPDVGDAGDIADGANDFAGDVADDANDVFNDVTPNVPNVNDGTGWFPNQPVEATSDWLAGSTDEWVGGATSGPWLPQNSGPWFPGLDEAAGGAADNVEGAGNWALGGIGDFLSNTAEGGAGTIGGTIGNLFGQLGAESGAGDAAGEAASFMQNTMLMMVLGFVALGGLMWVVL